MKIEQLLTTLNLKDGIYRVYDKTLVKKANSVSIMDSSDHSAFAAIVRPDVKLASVIDSVEIVMPSAVSRKYTEAQLERVASAVDNKKTLNQKVQEAIVKLASDNQPVPDTASMFALAAKLNGGKTPGLLTFKFAQWGGSGGMSGSESGSFSNFTFQGGEVNEHFGRWQSNTMFDSMLDQARKNDAKQWATSTEGKLAEAGFYNHKYADENAMKYNMAWGDRIKAKNLGRLRKMFEQRKTETKHQNEYTPEYIRTHEELNPRHFTSVETFLSDQRGEDAKDYLPKSGRMAEWLPKWYSQLHTLRQENGLKKAASYNFESGSAPGRRGTPDDAENTGNPDGGIIGSQGQRAMAESAESIVEQQGKGSTESGGWGSNFPYTGPEIGGAPDSLLVPAETREPPFLKEYEELKMKPPTYEDEYTQGSSDPGHFSAFDFEMPTQEQQLDERRRGIMPKRKDTLLNTPNTYNPAEFEQDSKSQVGIQDPTHATKGTF